MHKLDNVVIIAVVSVAISIPFIIVLAATAFVDNAKADHHINSESEETEAAIANIAAEPVYEKGETPSQLLPAVQKTDGYISENTLKKRIFLEPSETSTFAFGLPESGLQYDRVSMSIAVHSPYHVIFELQDMDGNYACVEEEKCKFVILGIDNARAVADGGSDKDKSQKSRISIPVDQNQFYLLKMSNPEISNSQIVDINLTFK